MRICMLSTTYRPRVGGMETHVATLAEALVRDGHKVTIFTNRDSITQPEEADENGVRVVRTSALLEGRSDPDVVQWEASMFGLLRDVERWIVTDDFDVVHAHAQASLLLTALSGLSVRLPVVVSPHETQPETDPCGLYRSQFVYSAGTADLVLVGSRRFAEQMGTFGVPTDRVRIVHHGLPAAPQIMSRATARGLLHEQVGIDTDRVLITLVGRFKERKGQLRLLDAIDAMVTRSRCTFVLAGSCSSADRDYLGTVRKRVAAMADVADVMVLEDVSEQVRDLLWAASDVATQPSTHEGLGLAAVEAMRACVPVVASDIDGLREVVADGAGTLVDTVDSTAYATALDRLVDDPDLRSRIGKAGAVRADQLFSVDRLTVDTVTAYREAIKLREAR